VGVGAIVLRRRDDRCEVLLIQRGRPPNVGSWSLPGGRLEWGESIVDGIAREVHEETSLEVVVGDLVEVVELRGDDFHYIVIDHAAKPVNAASEPRAGDDARDARWVDVDRLEDLAVTEAVARVVATAVARSG
jgi:8-oxo-dGTP diphosphatase